MNQDARIHREGNELQIDTRGMSPPGPMVSIMRVLADCKASETVLALLDRDPVYLYPELAEAGWMAETISSDEVGVVLRISRPAA